MARRVLAWECRYCGALKKTELICNRHEVACPKNPDRKNCIDCVYCGEDNVCIVRGCGCSTAVSPYCQEYKREEG
jgi:hypothetical protein